MSSLSEAELQENDDCSCACGCQAEAEVIVVPKNQDAVGGRAATTVLSEFIASYPYCQKCLRDCLRGGKDQP